VKIRKILFVISLGLLLAGSQIVAHATAVQKQGGQQSQQQATKSVSGKVTGIGNQGKSFTVEVGNGDSKQTLEFVVDGQTKVEGHVTTGTMVVVEYQSMDGGQNLCVRVSAQQG